MNNNNINNTLYSPKGAILCRYGCMCTFAVYDRDVVCIGYGLCMFRMGRFV